MKYLQPGFLNIISSIISIGALMLFSKIGIGRSEVEIALLVSMLWAALFFVILFINTAIPKKILLPLGHIAHYLMLDGILLLTAAAAVIAFNSIIIGSPEFTLNSISYFAVFYVIFSLIVKSLTKYLIIVALGGLFAPIILAVVLGSINGILLTIHVNSLDGILADYFWAFFAIDIAISIAVVWYAGLSEMIKNMDKHIIGI